MESIPVFLDIATTANFQQENADVSKECVT